MYKLLIIDDEPLVRMGIKLTIEWQNYNIKIIGEATNGIDGLKLVKEYDPDIILSDIKMPLMDGLEFVSELRKTTSDAECIILSGYKDFEYAKNTLENGAFAYLLKPLKNEDLVDTVLKAIDKLNEKRKHQELIKSVTKDLPLIKNTIIQQLLTGNMHEVEEILKNNNPYDISIPSKGLVIFGKIDNATEYTDSSVVKKSCHALYKIILDHLSNQSVGIIYYSHFVILTDTFEIEDTLTSSLKTFEKHHLEMVSLGVSSIYESYSSIYDAYLNARKNAKTKLLLTMNTIAYDDKNHMPYHSTVVEAIKYISKNYKYALNINTISYDLGVSPSHLMHLFKEDLNQTVNEFLTEYRILMAQKLLMQKKLKIYEVANSVGINDSKYFSQVFKKIVGISPADYIVQIIGESSENS